MEVRELMGVVRQVSIGVPGGQANLQEQWNSIPGIQSSLQQGQLQQSHGNNLAGIQPAILTGTPTVPGPVVVPGNVRGPHMIQTVSPVMGTLAQLNQTANQNLLQHTMHGPGNPGMRSLPPQKGAAGQIGHQRALQIRQQQGQILPGGVVQRGSVPSQQMWSQDNSTNQGQVYGSHHHSIGQIQSLHPSTRSGHGYAPVAGYSNRTGQQGHHTQPAGPAGRSGVPPVLSSSSNRNASQQFQSAMQGSHNAHGYGHLQEGTNQVMDGRPLVLSSGMQMLGSNSGQLNMGTLTPSQINSKGLQGVGTGGGSEVIPQAKWPTASLDTYSKIPPPLTSGHGNQIPSGFTHSQLSVLRQQILVFKRLKKGEWNLPPEMLSQICPPPLPQKAGRSIATATHLSYLSNLAPQSGLSNANPFASNSIVPMAQQDFKQLSASGKQPSIRRFSSALCGLACGGDSSSGRLTIGNDMYQLSWDVAPLMAQEFERVMSRKRKRSIYELEEQLKKPAQSGFSISQDGKLGRGLLMTKLRQARLLNFQKALRRTVEHCQMDIMKLNERTYRKFVRDCNRRRFEMFKQSEKARVEKASERAQFAKRMKVVIMEKSATLKDYRVVRNKGVLRLHERQARKHNKLKDDDRAKRLEALKANDFEGYQALLREQSGPATAGERYAVISRFLCDTEEYLNKLAAKVAAVKLNQEASEAAAQAIAEARDQGLSEEEVQIAARDAAQEVASNSELVRRSQNFGEDAQSRYYSLAHSVEEQVMRQPSLLRPPQGASLREYQMVGLQWMVSLYNNRLNGILADEMGLGKTVQVMALIAYLMEHKGNYGPHLIIVPNAVIVNWKSELMRWLPSVRCVYYVGHKEDRARKYQQEVQAMQFNVLVTTYEFIMRDRAKLSKIQWKYLVIDEAQRMKDRQSKLAKDLDRFTAIRRLLLTGTPLQNELRELWSLLNLLLPEVFDDKKSFTEWFGDALGQGPQGDEDGDAEWLEMEKRVVVIHRLHEILEPFMLRRQVEDVESKLPPKIPVVVKVPMSGYQSKIYNWVKATGTVRLDPESPMFLNKRHSFAPLNNKVMELRKVCNHPFLTYPYREYTEEDLVHQCGKLHLLDRILVKLHHNKHRVLLFSTMTKLLDILEIYLKWRRLKNGASFTFRRIDGGTTLEDREAAIKDFNQPDSDVFIFLLSIRAAGRGLNLQTADTVIIYDPDPNPKNEEQAIARAHRIGQVKEVKVIYLEAVADPLLQESKGTSSAVGGTGKLQYLDSIESLVRNTIQKQKIEMANEVIDAGRFDMCTTNEERKQTLENLLQDEERFKNHTNEVPTMRELNRMIGRGEEEIALFDSLDDDLSLWPGPLLLAEESPPWILFTEDQILETIRVTSSHQKKAQVQVNLLGLSGSMKAPQHDAVAKGKRITRSHRYFSSSSALVDDEDEEEDENVSGVGDDEDDVEEVLGENIEMDMDDTGTTDETTEGVSFTQQDDGCSMMDVKGASSDVHSQPPSLTSELKVATEEERADDHPASKTSKQTGKKSGLTVRFKSKWRD